MKHLLTKVLFAGSICFVVNQSTMAQSKSDSITSGELTPGLDYGYGSDDTPLVTVGSQAWLGKNLNVERFANGDPIPEARTNEEWKHAEENKQPAWCYYNNDPANGPTYGRLYNWYAVNDPRRLAPNGWHVPSDTEWDSLIKHFAGNSTEVNRPVRLGNDIYFITEDVGTLLKSTRGWKKNKGTNTSGIAGLPGGNRLSDGAFNYISEYGSWWSSTEDGTNNAWYRGLYYGNGKVNRFSFYKNCGFSVRCIKD